MVSEQTAENAPGVDPIAIPAHPSSVPLASHHGSTGTLRMMRRLLLVANPSASGFTASLHRDVVEILAAGYLVTPVWPNGPAQARSDAAAAAAEGYDTVVAMGGDGVVHQVANGLIGSTTRLGVVPAGTTNVFGRITGFPRDPRKAAEAIAKSSSRTEVPALRLTLDVDGGTTTTIATFAAGIGFDAEVIRESERRPLGKVGFGALHYARSAAKVSFGGFRRRSPTLMAGDGLHELRAVAVQFQVHEEYTFLGRIPLRLTTGSLPAAAVLAAVTPLRLTSAVMRASRSGVAGVRGVEVWEGFRRVEVVADEPTWVEADGELLGLADRLVAEPAPQQLVVVSA